MFTTRPCPSARGLADPVGSLTLLLRLGARLGWMLLAFAGGGHLAGQTPSTGHSPEAARLLIQADSMLQADKPVSALTLYRGVTNHTFDLCQLAQAHEGMAQVYLRTGNEVEAQAALTQAAQGLIGCDHVTRLRLVQRLAEGWMALYQEETALQLVEDELTRQPDAPALMTLRVRIEFARGEFRAAEAAVDRLLHHIAQDGATPALRVELQKIKILSHLFATETLTAEDLSALDRELLALPAPEALAVRESIFESIAARNLHEQAWTWASQMLAKTPPNDAEALARTYLKMATSAHRAQREIDAVFAHEQAVRQAGLSGNNLLLADALRAHAYFERDRGNETAALGCLWQLDSLQHALLLAQGRGISPNAKSFVAQTTADPDPFESAVAQIQSGQHLPHRSGMWPWWLALLALALLSFGLHNRQLRRTLRTERSRMVRLRSMVPLSPETWTAESEPADVASLQDVRTFLRELDAELLHPIRWEVTEDTQVTLTPQVRQTLRQLLQRFKELGGQNHPIDIRVEQIGREWRFSLASEHTEASKALQGLFTGRESAGTPVWRQVYQQLQAVAARVMVERISSHRERLTVTLPVEN